MILIRISSDLFLYKNICLYYNGIVVIYMERIILHIDVNNAFLSWTAVDLLRQGFDYDIRNSYAVISGDETKRRGIVLAKSMPAKKKGIVTGETLYSARKKCPNLKVYSSNYQFYQEMSIRLMKLIYQYSPDLEQVSIDECFLDYGKVKKLYGDEVEFAHKLKNEVKEKLGFTVNIGIGNNKLCAKMASDFSKPDQVHTLYQYEVKDKMWPLSVDELFGVGRQTAPKLHQLGIHTIYDLAHADPLRLEKYFKSQAFRMMESANGVDRSLVESMASSPKGIGNETTMPHDVDDLGEINQYLLALSDNVALRLRKEGKYAHVVVVVVKDYQFRKYSHQKKLKNATNLSSEIYEASKEVFREMWNGESVRLIGVRLDQLVDNAYHQVSLFEDVGERESHTELDKTVDQLKEKFGNGVIGKASLEQNKVMRKDRIDFKDIQNGRFDD